MSDATPRGWSSTTLGDVTIERSERVGADPAPVVLSSTKHFGLVPSDDFFKNRTIYSSDLSNYKIVRRDWFAYATNHLAEGSIGLQNLCATACVSPIYTVFSCRSAAEPRYLFRLLKRPEMLALYQVREQASVDRRGAVRYSDFATIPIGIPSPSEQARISDVLDAIDDAIATTERTIMKLTQVKLGLLHDLLSRGIDESGKPRDPNRNPEMFHTVGSRTVPVGWRDCQLATVVDPRRPIVYGILMPGSGFAGGVPVVKVKDIRDGRISEDDLLLTDPRIDTEYRRSRLREGDLLFSIRGTVGRTAFVPAGLEGANITQDTARISIRGANARFVAHYLQTRFARTFIEVHTLGQAVRGINLRDVRRIPLSLPPTPEQDAIAAVLDAQDARVQAEQQRHDKLRLLKSGLIADLLTGRVRVKCDGKP